MFQFLLKRDSAFPALLLLLACGIGLSFFPSPAMMLTPESGPLALLMVQHPIPVSFQIGIWLFLLLFQSWQFHRLHQIQGLSEDRDSLFLFSYGTMLMLVPAMRVTSDIFLAQSLLLWSLIDLKAVYTQAKTGRAFNMGLKLSLAFLFYKPIILVFPALQLCMLLGGAITFRLFLVGWLGFISPLYLVGGTLYLFNELDAFLAVTTRLRPEYYPLHLLDKRLWFPISVVYGATLILAFWFRSQRRIEVQYQVYNQLHWALMFLLVLVVIFIPNQGLRAIVFCLIPLAYFNARLLKQLGKPWTFEVSAILQMLIPFAVAFILTR